MSKAQKKDKKQDVAVYLVTPNKIMLTPKIQHTPREPSPLSDDTIRRMQHHDKASPSKLSQDTNRKFFASLVGLLEYMNPYVKKLQPFLKAENIKVSVVASSRRSQLI